MEHSAFIFRGQEVQQDLLSFEDEGTIFLQNIRNFLPSDIASYPGTESQITS
jgi:hypothetical protein